MASLLGRKIFRQIPRSFVASGTIGNFRSCSDLSAARLKARYRHIPKQQQQQQHRVPPSMTLQEFNDSLPSVGIWIPVVAAMWWVSKTVEDNAKVCAEASLKAYVRESMKEYYKENKKILEGMGVTREVCEARIAQRKKKLKKESAWKDDSLLDIYESWLGYFIKAEE